MPENVDNGSSDVALSRFISERVAPLAHAFASTPLMELRVTTAEGSVRFVRAAPEPVAAPRPAAPKPAPRTGPRPHLTPDATPGKPYHVINAEVVGLFTAAPDLPAPGASFSEDRVLGYIEALKLKHPVRSGGPAVLVAQVAEDGQAVDFGEPLFVVDRAAGPTASPGTAPASSAPEAPSELLEPPRL